MAAFRDYLFQLDDCIRRQCWYPALALALALPDICASLEGIKGNYEQRVTTWLERNQKYLALGADVIYAARCSFLHNGSGILGDAQKPKGRIVLLSPPGDGTHSHNVKADGTKLGEYHVEVDDLVRCMLNAAGPWADAHDALLKDSEASGRLLAILPNPGSTRGHAAELGT